MSSRKPSPTHLFCSSMWTTKKKQTDSTQTQQITKTTVQTVLCTILAFHTCGWNDDHKIIFCSDFMLFHYSDMSELQPWQCLCRTFTKWALRLCSLKHNYVSFTVNPHSNKNSWWLKVMQEKSEITVYLWVDYNYTKVENPRIFRHFPQQIQRLVCISVAHNLQILFVQ